MLQLIATFLPLYGAAASLVAIMVFRGALRWSLALLIPLVTLAICQQFGGEIAQNGNMLFAVVLLSYVLFLMYVYYPALAIWGAVSIVLRYRRSRRRESRP
jgi:hypothetical protein